MSPQGKQNRFVVFEWSIISLLILLSVGCGPSTFPTNTTDGTSIPGIPNSTKVMKFFTPTVISTSTPTILPTIDNSTPVPSFESYNLTFWLRWDEKAGLDQAIWAPDSQHLLLTRGWPLPYKTSFYDIYLKKVVWENAKSGRLIFNLDGTKVISSANNVELWDTATGKTIDEFIEPYSFGNTEWYAAFLGQNELLLSRTSWIVPEDTAHTIISKWMVEQKRQDDVINVDALMVDLQVNADREEFAAAFIATNNLAETDREIFLWNLHDDHKICTFPGDVLAFNPVEPILAVSSSNEKDSRYIKLYNTSTCSLLKKLSVLESKGNIGSFAYSPDGKVIAVTPSNENIIYLLDSATGEILHAQPGYWDVLAQLAFSPDGCFLMAREESGAAGIIHVWEVTRTDND